jgi:hypothetical protein
LGSRAINTFHNPKSAQRRNAKSHIQGTNKLTHSLKKKADSKHKHTTEETLLRMIQVNPPNELSL